MYGPAGERRLTELELDWLDGYEGSKPVRIGNGASAQFQLDVYGEVLDMLYQARRRGLVGDDSAWALSAILLASLEQRWHEPDEGIWEVRGPRRHFTHSKVMAWVAFDRGLRLIDELGRAGPDERWRDVRDAIKAEVLERGFDEELGSFVQSYGSKRRRREPADDPALRLPPGGRSARARHARGGPPRAARRRLRAALPPRRRAPSRWTDCRRARAPSSSAPSGSSTT